MYHGLEASRISGDLPRRQEQLQYLCQSWTNALNSYRQAFASFQSALSNVTAYYSEEHLQQLGSAHLNFDKQAIHLCQALDRWNQAKAQLTTGQVEQPEMLVTFQKTTMKEVHLPAINRPLRADIQRVTRMMEKVSLSEMQFIMTCLLILAILAL